MTAPPGISITEIAVTRAIANPDNISRAYIFGTSNGTQLNTPVSIENATDASTKFPGMQEITLQSIKLIYKNYPEASLYFVSAKDPAVADLTSIRQHFVYATNLLGSKTDLEIGYITAPEVANSTVQDDRTTIYAAFNGMCEKTDCIHLFNTGISTDDEDKAVTERDLYTSNNGHSWLYYSLPTDSEDKRVPMAAIGTAIALRAGAQNPYRPPGGPDFPITGIKTFNNPVDTVPKYEKLRDKNINCAYKIRGIGTCIWLTRTLSTDEKFQQANTRMAISLITTQLTDAVIPLLFEPSDPRGATREEVLAVITSILQQAYEDGGLSGATTQQAYRIEEVTSTVVDLTKVTVKAFARFVETLEQIEIQLVNVDTIPNAA